MTSTAEVTKMNDVFGHFDEARFNLCTARAHNMFVLRRYVFGAPNIFSKISNFSSFFTFLFVFHFFSCYLFNLFHKNFKIHAHFRLYNTIVFFHFHLLSQFMLFVLMYAILFPIYAFCLNVCYFFLNVCSFVFIIVCFLPQYMLFFLMFSMFAILCLSFYAFCLNICILSLCLLFTS